MATPNVRGLGSALAQLQHGFDIQAKKLLDRTNTVAQRGNDAFKKASGNLDANEAAIAEVEAFNAELEAGANGGPPLDGSSTQSDAPAAPSAAEPQASWHGDKPQT